MVVSSGRPGIVFAALWSTLNKDDAGLLSLVDVANPQLPTQISLYLGYEEDSWWERSDISSISLNQAETKAFLGRITQYSGNQYRFNRFWWQIADISNIHNASLVGSYYPVNLSTIVETSSTNIKWILSKVN